MKLFHFYRLEDQSGVSGTGPVVEGVQFTNGWCALRWLSKNSSVCFYQSIEDVKSIHSHGGKTEIIIHDFEPLRKSQTVACNARFEIFMQIIEETSDLINRLEDQEVSPASLDEKVEGIQVLLENLRSNLKFALKKAS